MSWIRGILLGLVAMGVIAAPVSARTKVAVFNFQMQSETPEWIWLEKGLADRITTDFARSKRLTVIARDAMQRVAEQMDWVPEMAVGDPDRMGYIRKQLKIEYLISGVYRVTGSRVAITAQIVEVATHREVARREVSGKLDDVLVLQQRVSAELLSWFSGTPAARILPQLPVWTRSIPAVKALYEGMHLYDQGRYGEAWYRFRRAAREDPVYVEAQYWVGKMYYFMDRYLHARRAYEAFVYLDSAHPRMGDAIKEYLHTHESLGTPPDELLALYGDFAERFPTARIRGELGVFQLVENRTWLQARSAIVLGMLNRHDEAVLSAAEAVKALNTTDTFLGFQVRAALVNVIALNAKTGRVLLPDALLWDPQLQGKPRHMRFPADDLSHSRAAIRLTPPPGVYTWVVGSQRRHHYVALPVYFYAVAPDGYIFKRIKFVPTFQGTDGTCHFYVSRDGWGDIAETAPTPIPEISKRGVTFDNLPRTGVLRIQCRMSAKDQNRDPKIYMLGISGLAELEKVGSHGSIEIDCDNASRFLVQLDGRHARKFRGLIGMVPPGRYKLSVTGEPDSPYGEWTRRVRVKEGETVSLTAHLPWRRDSIWADWTSPLLLGGDYSSRNVYLDYTLGPPAIQMDSQGIRVVWAREGDLWSSVSTDGTTFSAPSRLDLPVSSGWKEERPEVFRDESGRFILTFISDRDRLHNERLYICWSRDFVHWSAPVMVCDRYLNRYHVIQDDRGRYLAAMVSRRKTMLFSSRDASKWELVTGAGGKGYYFESVRILQDSSGEYQVLHSQMTAGDASEHNVGAMMFFKIAGNDLDKLTYREIETGPLRPDDCSSLSVFSVKGVNQMMAFGDDRLHLFQPKSAHAMLVSEQANYMGRSASMGYHPKWEYVISWRQQAFSTTLTPETGPFVIRGRSLAKIFPTANFSSEPPSARTLRLRPRTVRPKSVLRGKIQLAKNYYHDLDRKDKAREILRKAIQENPKDPRIEEAEKLLRSWEKP